ncbi:MAG: DUF4347 domain-containing protein [Acidobacteria bacterium]|nr:DUF4347 domain-containing protein [Acidobacteriota bacterium]
MSGMSIDVVDGNPSPDDNGFVQAAQDALQGEVRVNTVGHMVGQIIRRLGQNGRIRRLRVFGHGNPGSQGLGQSHSNWSPTHNLAVRSGVLQYATKLGELRNRFEPGGWAELHGCEVGAGVAGQLALFELARAWGVPVKASRTDQYVGGGLEGQVIVVWPNGHFELRNSDRQRGEQALARGPL